MQDTASSSNEVTISVRQQQQGMLVESPLPSSSDFDRLEAEISEIVDTESNRNVGLKVIFLEEFFGLVLPKFVWHITVFSCE